MFESDDFDEALSQFDFSEPKLQSTINKNNNINVDKMNSKPNLKEKQIATSNSINNENVAYNGNKDTLEKTDCSPKYIKRKIINSHFNHSNKRKFPGPAGLLTGSLEHNKDDSISHLEVLSQDIDFTQNNIRRDLFESPLWKRLCEDIQNWKLSGVDSIKSIKQQALAGNLRRRKAQTVTAFVEAVDRSVIDPLIVLRDLTESIKCTLHRDAWMTFSPYLVSDYCSLVLYQPTVLTTGSAFKKHYLNITLSNIFGVYSSAVLKDEEIKLPEGYKVVYAEDFTVIKSDNKATDSIDFTAEEDSNLLDGLDSIFSDDLF